MKILFACEYFPPFAPGGAEWSTFNLATALVNSGNDVVVVTPNYGATPYEEINSVKIYRFPFWCKILPGQKSVKTIWISNFFFYFYYSFFLWWYGRREKSEVLHAQSSNALPAAFISSKLLKIPIFFTIRDTGIICPIGAVCLIENDKIPKDCSFIKLKQECSDFYVKHYVHDSLLRNQIVKLSLPIKYIDIKFKQAILKRISGITAVSNGIFSIYENANVITSNRSETVYTLPPLEKDDKIDREVNNQRTVLYVGKLSVGKGAQIFIEAADIVAKEITDVIFLMAGKGSIPYKPKIANLKFLGSLPYSEVLSLYTLTDIVVLPSIWPEPFSRVPLEAAMFEKPCIASKTGGTPEAIVDGETGLLVEKSNPKALADAILTLLQNRELCISMGKKAKLFVEEKFNSQKISNQIIEIYKKSLEEKS